MMMTPEMLNTAVEGFVASCQKMINDYYGKQFSSLTPPTLSVERNPRYWRIVRTEQPNGSRSVHCFIDPQTGDVLKSDGWKRPAKGARGNLLDDSKGMARMSPYGAAYNR